MIVVLSGPPAPGSESLVALVSESHVVVVVLSCVETVKLVVPPLMLVVTEGIGGADGACGVGNCIC